MELRTTFHERLLEHYREQLLPILGDCHATLVQSPQEGDGLLKINAYVFTRSD